MSGLPGVGKSAIADALGHRLRAVVVSVDPIEDAMMQAGIPQSHESGLAAYRVGATVAAHQLRNGLLVIADAANYLDVGRQIWTEAAQRAEATIRCFEVVCSDVELHRARLESRQRNLPFYPEVTWDDVLERKSATEPWATPVLQPDTARPFDEVVDVAVRELLR